MSRDVKDARVYTFKRVHDKYRAWRPTFYCENTTKIKLIQNQYHVFYYGRPME